MSKKKDNPKFDIWVKRTHTFTAQIEADTLEQAVEIAGSMTEDALLDAPGDTIESEFELTGVLKA